MKKYIAFLIVSFGMIFSGNVLAKEIVDTSTLNLLKQSFKENQDNMVVSGLSIVFATDMLANGAQGKALKELTTFFNATLEEKNNELQSNLQNLPKTLEITNSIWGDKFAPSYQTKLQNLFNVDVMSLPKHTSVINNWIKEKTHGKIPTVLAPEKTDPLHLYLVNTIYFKDNWQTSFEKDDTREQVFHALSGHDKKVPMMHKKLKVGYAENTKLQSIKLPYKNGGSMVIYLPKEGVDFKEFISKLSVEDFNLNYVSVKVSVSLPKFKIDKQTDVIPLFKELGVNEIFKQTHDLRAIAGVDGYVDKIAHRAVVEIDEEGTEAAAATAIRVVSRMAPRLRFVANRPFLFFITQGDFVGVYTGDE